jgi:hypothetical protein
MDVPAPPFYKSAGRKKVKILVSGSGSEKKGSCNCIMYYYLSLEDVWGEYIKTTDNILLDVEAITFIALIRRTGLRAQTCGC